MNLIILGSTGSIGTQTLAVVKKNPRALKVIGLACHSNENLLKKQAKTFNVPKSKTVLTSRCPKKLKALIQSPQADIIVNAISGSAGLAPSIEALKAGKTLVLANKESLILDGKRLMQLAKKHHAKILPLDSEHHAILRLLQTRSLEKYSPKHVKKITLTCSGGPFYGYTKTRLAQVAPKQALKNPNWKMGPKILVESALLLNKGFEIIEAHHLFSCPLNRIDAIIDRKSYVHAIVEFHGGPAALKGDPNTIALAYKPDMKTVIENTLLPHKTKKLKFLTATQLKNYPFKKIDHKTFPAINRILQEHKKDTLKPFYKHTEKNITRFLNGKSPITEIF